MDMSFFAEMAWKSALISGAALALAYALRSRSAADRALVLRIGVVMLLLLPLIALWLPVVEIVAFAAPESPAPVAVSIPPELQSRAFDPALASTVPPSIWDDPTPLVLIAYAGGLFMALARLLGGLWTLGRWTRNARVLDCPEWQEAFERVRWSLDDPDRVRLLVSDEVASPLSWGWRRPVILVDLDTARQSGDADAVLAHELAHVARRDWPALIATRIAATLFWFNPLVWLLEREVVQQTEEAADCAAAQRVEPTRYAETLLSWAQSNHALPANSIAPSARALGRRIRNILDRKVRERPSGSAWTALAMMTCLALAAPVAAMQLVAAQAPDAPEPPLPPEAPLPPTAPFAPDAPPIPGKSPHPGEAPLAPEARADAAEIEASVHAALAEVLPQIPHIVAQATAGIEPRAMEEALDEAEAELRDMDHLSRAEMNRALAEIRGARTRIRTIDRDRIHAVAVARAPHLPPVEAARIRREVHAAVRTAPRAAALAMSHGADGMVRGADGMDQGALRMLEQARLLRNREHREREIARARARGHAVTHEELLEAADGLEEGAEEMREGAREMRVQAAEMRRRH